MTTLTALLLCASPLFAQATGSAVSYRHADEIEWKVSGSLPPGAEFHLMYEEPKTHALQTMVRFPSGYTLPSHSHKVDETIVVVKGKVVVDFGGSSAQTLEPGSFIVIPAGVMHSLKAKGQLIMMMAVNGMYDVQGLPSVKQ